MLCANKCTNTTHSRWNILIRRRRRRRPKRRGKELKERKKNTRTPSSFNTSYFVICTSWALSLANLNFISHRKNHSIIWNIAFAWDALLLFIVDVGYDGGSQQNYDVDATAGAAVYFTPSLLRWNAICFSSIRNCSCAMHTQWTFWRVREKKRRIELNRTIWATASGGLCFFLPFIHSFFLSLWASSHLRFHLHSSLSSGKNVSADPFGKRKRCRRRIPSSQKQNSCLR